MQVNLTNQWQEVSSVNCTFQLKTAHEFEVLTSAAAPLESDEGFILQSLQLNFFTASDTKKLWARSKRTDAVLIVSEA